MAKAHICLYFVILLYLYSEGTFTRVNAEGHHGEWCVAKPATKKEKLQQIIDFACSKVNCAAISNGGACYSPEDLLLHASVAMNNYYQAEGRHFWNCNFAGSGIIAITDPSEFHLIFFFVSKQL
ncbi:hypothetical protein YC2023_093982 [Brassica napus]